MSHWPPGIYVKLFIAFVLVVLPIIGISFMMNEFGARSVNQQITESSDSTVGLYMNLLEQDLERVIGLQREFINDVKLNELSARWEFMSNYEIRAAVNEIGRGLRLLKMSGSYNEDARVHIPSMKRTISASSDSIGDIPADEYEALKVPLDPLESPLYSYNKKLYHVINYPDASMLPPGVEPLFQLVLELSVEKLKQGLLQFNTSPGSMTVLMGNGWSVGQGDGDKGGKLSEELLLRGNTGQSTLKVEGQPCFLTAASSKKLGVTLFKVVPEKQIFGPLQTYRTYLWLLSGISLLLILLFSYGIHRLIHEPLKKMVNAFKRVEKGKLDLTIEHPYRDEFGYLYRQFNGMIAKLNVLIYEVYEKNYRLQLSEFRQLQSQINPHFLYNSFYIIYRMAKLQEHDRVMVFTKYLGDYFQFITRNDSETVTLEQEVRHVRNYAEIQTIRFTRRISVSFAELPVEAADIRVPRLILQPVVENAYKHALEDKEADGLLCITFRLTEDAVHVMVEDNGHLLTEQKLADLKFKVELCKRQNSAETTGLLNVCRRLQLMFGSAGELSVERSMLGGLLAVITIPRTSAEQPVRTLAESLQYKS